MPGRDQADETEQARPEALVPVAGLALPERAPAESGTRVGPADDPAELEAEATARSIVDVLRTINPAGLAENQARSAENQPGSAAASGGDTVRRDAVVGAEGGELDGATAGAIEQLRGSGHPLPASVRHGMEAAFGTDLADVRVHTGGTAGRLNQALQARAFTAGRDIVFADGMPDTTTADGQHLLAHELTHVLQNRGAGPIRRTLRKKNALADSSFNDLAQTGPVSKAPPAAQFVIRYWATSVNRVTYNSPTDLVKQARAAVPNMDASFTATLANTTEIKQFEESLGRLKITPSTTLTNALANRRDELENSWAKQLGPNYTLPSVTLPTHYYTPTALTTSVAEKTGRNDGGWTTTTNPILGTGGQTTGAPNAQLLLEEQSRGGLFTIGNDIKQICATCGQLTLANQFEVDHQQAFSDIRDKLHLLASAMACNASLYQSVESSTTDFNKLFQVTGTPGTSGCTIELLGAAVHIYSNDLQNLMRICRSCNGPWGKSDMAMVDWFRQSQYFGQDFLDEYQLPGTQLQVIERTNQDIGWGQAARSWFATFHLPILRQQELVGQLQEMLRQRLTQQSTTGIKAHREKNPTKKLKLVDDREQLNRNNQGLLAPLRVELEYQSGKLLGEEPYPFAPNSPERIENETIDLKKQRHKRKRNDSLIKRPSHDIGVQDGRTGVDTNRPDNTAGQEDIEAYQLGYDTGLQEYFKSVELGEAAALTAFIDLDLNAFATTDPVYDKAFRRVFEKRVTAWCAGYNTFKQNGMLDFGYAKGDPHAEVLLREYMTGYEVARQQSTNQMVLSNTNI